MFTDSVHLNGIQDRIRRNADKKSQIFFLSKWFENPFNLDAYFVTVDLSWFARH